MRLVEDEKTSLERVRRRQYCLTMVLLCVHVHGLCLSKGIETLAAVGSLLQYDGVEEIWTAILQEVSVHVHAWHGTLSRDMLLRCI